MNVKEWIQQNDVKIKNTRIPARPDGVGSPKQHHFLSVIGGPGLPTDLVVMYSQGEGRKPPTAAEVLGCVIDDVQGLTGSFEEWASECGYDVDSRDAESIYRAIAESRLKLKAFAGQSFYDLLRLERDD